MNLIKRNGSHVPAFQRLFFDDVFGRDLFNWENNNFSTTSTTLPSVNIKETDENYEVEVAAPGMSKDDFKVTLDNGQLLISSSKQEHVNKEEENYTRREFSYQSFQRSFILPKNVVDEDRIRARYENGILLLSIPKLEQARQKSPRMIEIS
ncbi:Hsp20/alpha crystallin family protein [Flavobacterium johnsoniae]|uniref:Heat shock protein Hsp20 n=1 Tax=Flavobacterium johnsoniae (strain ATCC 17061 / DSM 2064 / JCM 8514 / BCRC 14874 / CCUG 350202 / NBRC 14942 / NCIMB 11054 / UW101) TaxID=376686 RepID=A5FBJ9_FLAJ1|nr:Hsp20/alpha crystallin family protein [Flavobacterium johnsoniae]ABQ07419.1 heat shock protein Hsp20 [Flavobacterium johnsoniae UW101]OXE99328.1 heat-shock protein [Flavobacterium johnsoniae UW101]WQG80746.1 Hsp20/alpha crystallin family protein [Flavobacterium johnsoniae UW101]SHL13631.1 heat shock protein Hsp20 [Flavobacterium johnsoniae]